MNNFMIFMFDAYPKGGVEDLKTFAGSFDAGQNYILNTRPTKETFAHLLDVVMGTVYRYHFSTYNNMWTLQTFWNL